MTPKEKAIELLTRYRRHLPINTVTDLEVKGCALIAVNEILNSNPTTINSSPFLGTRIYENINYWQEVKQEIEKL